MSYILKKIEAENNQITSEIIKDILSEADKVDTKYKELFDRYSNKDIPILNRELPGDSKEKINNKINNPYDVDIVDTAQGYFMGIPIQYSYNFDDEVKGKTFQDKIDEFNLRNNTADIDGTSSKIARICGLKYRLLYVDTDGNIKIMLLNPWECKLIYDRSIDEPQYGIRYYQIEDIDNGNKVTRNRVEVYDSTYIYYYIENDEHNYVPDGEPQLHQFKGVPIIALLNNDEMLSDSERVLPLIDGYDKTLSDVNSEIEQFRLAYIVAEGVDVDDETVDAARQTGVFSFPNGGKMYFLTKNINDVVVENHLNRITENIYKFTANVDFTGDRFANATATAVNRMIFKLESKCIINERKMTTFLRKQWQLISTVWTLLPEFKDFDYLKVEFVFTRNMAVDETESIKANKELVGLVSERTRLEKLPFAVDVEQEVEAMAKEREMYTPYDTKQTEVTSGETEELAEDVAGKQLNGAQTQSLIAVVSQYADGLLTIGQAINIVSVAVGITKEEARKIIEGLA